jgi:acyl-CoA synthetase (AMP-forming)/AMP-acid ligase II
MNTFPDVLYSIHREAPEQAAIHLLRSGAPDQAITYRRLLQGAAGYARALVRLGANPGDVVILILDHGEALVYAFFGAILGGTIPSIMPFLTEKLSPDQYRVALATLFEITTPAAVVTNPTFAGEVALAGSRYRPRAVLLSDQVVLDENPELHTLPGFNRTPEEIALLQHSSGTTGLQKGVALSHQAVFNQLRSYAEALHLRSDDVIVSWLPLYHDMGLIAGFILPILSRTPLVLMSPFDWVRAPQRLMQAVWRYRGTLTWLPNFAYNFCAQKVRPSQLEGVDLSSWRAVINCSEPMHWVSHQMFLERFQPYNLRPEALATCYAMAETVFAVTQGGIDAPVTVDPVDGRLLVTRQVAVHASGSDGVVQMLSAGRPIQNTQLRILDAKGRDLPERHIGEIAIYSDCMLSGYFRRPDLTEKAFLDGWYLSGDLGYLAGGELYITGRKKDLIIVGGKNIYPQDLERLANDIPGVHPGRVVAFGVFNPELGTEDVVVLVESDEDDLEKRLAIAEQIRLRVTRGSDVALRNVQVVERGWLLKTSSGKIARSANREKYLKESTGPTSSRSQQAGL